ncbi:MAG: class I SAM-dependent rRNA methyltransferase [Bacteroidetes bacterium]|nr:class I SAM-dependent rRNA methyltransferase [Bacteroidota bacterium]MBK9672272.1 class I SAM-dependent rRNA methyltransferase [Bacteroidota bacterium]MBK9800102.1 class I SAM-dependent rRNA methyltransferase [Bacteroidota bacterium]
MQQAYPKVILSSGKDQSLRRFHPWVFSGAIKKIKNSVGKEIEPSEGELVSVVSNHDEFLGIGHYQLGSIAVRVFSFEECEINQAFWDAKIAAAYNLRKVLNLTSNAETNVYRLLHAEGDGMPGLIIDFYNGTAVLQTHSIGMHLIKKEICQSLQKVYGKTLHAIYDKSEETMPKQSAVKAENGVLWGETKTNEVKEYGNLFSIDWASGQKTGFFIDQRENRNLLAQYCKGKSVANTFCYSGGFSVFAMRAGATLVHSVDSSKKAIELTDKNIELNKSFFPKQSEHASFAIDTFDFLETAANKYDVIILDPPAFAKHQNVKHNAVQGYKRLNAEAFKKIKAGGILFTFSCSQVVDTNLFNSTVMAAAIIAKRKVHVLHYLNQPQDHAPSIFHPEGAYLKGLVLYVE